MENEVKKRVWVAGRSYQQWCDDNREHLREKHRGYYAKYYADPKKHEMEVARRKRWNEAHKDQVYAMQRINYYIKKGLVIRKPCEKCGAEKANAHHDDYTRPLNVRWLCPIHHSEWHKSHEPKHGEVNKEMTTKDLEKIKAGFML